MILFRKKKGGNNMSAMSVMSSDYASGYDYGYSNPNSFNMEATATWLVIAAVIAVIGGILLYFTFLSKRNEGKYKGFLGWTYEFLNFKRYTIEAILKITYLMLTIFITLASFTLITTSFGAFVLALFLGNLVLRIIYEFALVMLIICRNTTDISNKLNKKDE